MLLTKSAEWMHEKEWRLLDSPSNAAASESPSPGCWPYQIDSYVVREVIVGARATAALSDRVVALLAEDDVYRRHVQRWRCVIDEELFRLNVLPLEKKADAAGGNSQIAHRKLRR